MGHASRAVGGRLLFPQNAPRVMQPDFDHETPAGRKSALRAIAQGDVVHHHESLRRIFTAEVEFDLQFGFDIENMLGAGPARTLAWLREHGMQEIADHLAHWCDGDRAAELARWSVSHRRYFLGT